MHFTGSSYRVDVTDGSSSGSHSDMSLKDWMSYSVNDDRDRLLIMSVEFSRSKLETCIELPEIVCWILCTSFFLSYWL